MNDHDTAFALFREKQSASERMRLRRTAWKYLRKHDVESHDDLAAILFWQELDTDVLEAVADWLATAKAEVEFRGGEWTTDEMARYEQEHPE